MNTHHKHRILLAAVKVGTFVAWWAGVPDPIIAAVVTPWALWWAFRIIREGLRENYWVDPKVQARWHWEDLVWGQTVWVNRESPQEGIERLSGHLRETGRSNHVRPTPVESYPEKVSTGARSPSRAPHELAVT